MMTAMVAAEQESPLRRRNALPCQLSGQRGFTLLELIVVVCVVCALFLTALNKTWELQTTAERATMEYNVGALRSALALQFVAKIVQQDEEGIAQLAGINPMVLLNQVPGNYLGEFDGVDPTTLKVGNWYFDQRQKMLVYLVRNSHFFRSPLSGPPRVRWSVRLDFAAPGGSAASGSAKDHLEGISLVPQEGYFWREKE